jgi:hypothetical protein
MKEQYLIFIPTAYVPTLQEYIIDREFIYSVSVITLESLDHTDLAQSIKNAIDSANPDYVLLINVLVLYETIPIPPYSGIIPSDRLYHNKCGRIVIKNETELLNCLHKFINFIPGQRLLLVGDNLDTKTDGCKYNENIILEDATRTALCKTFTVYDVIREFEDNDLVSIITHSGAGGFGKIFTNEVPWFTNTIYPIVYCMGCYAGDFTKDYSLAVAGLVSGHCWSTIIAGSVYQFYAVGAVGGPSLTLDKLFWQNYDYSKTIGEALYKAKQAMPPTNPDDFRQWTLASVNIIGDPTLPLIANFELKGNINAYDGDVLTLINRDNGNIYSTVCNNGSYYFNNLEPGIFNISVNSRSNAASIDALYIAQYFTGTRQFTDIQKKLADVNGDGTINSTDSMMVQQHFVGMINTYPVGETLILDTVEINKLHTTKDITIYFYGEVSKQ